MNEYEISYVSDPTLAEDARDDLDKGVDTVIEDAKGSIVSNTENLRRKMAYPVLKHSSGFLRTVQATIDQTKVETIRQALQKQDGIIRLSILQTKARESVAATIFDSAAKEEEIEKASAPAEQAIAAEDKKPAKKISDTELEDKIAKALEEEVK